ncbi:MAG: TonB-dependent receptor plug domain-containing protein, partial [Pyrinomonadaceae bacterium]
MYADRPQTLLPAHLLPHAHPPSIFPRLFRIIFAALLCLAPVVVPHAFGQEAGSRGGSSETPTSAETTPTAGPLFGRVLDTAGAAIEGATITLRNVRTGAERSAIIPTDGTFTFAGLAPGEYELSVTAENFNAPPRAVTLRAGQESRGVEIRMVPRGFDEFVTVNAGEQGYQAATATTAMRTDIALRDTPQSIQVITRQVIEEQQAVTIGDVVRNVSGVSVPNSSGGRAEDFTVRGFTSSRNTYKDGFRNDFNSNRAAHETSNVERVEVLKGPASVLFGRLDPSGVVNLVTKKPLAEHHYSAQLIGGKFGLFRPSFDLGGPLNARKTLLYRFNAASENADTFRDFVEKERYFAAPSLTWIVGDKTSLNFDAEVMKGTSLIDRGLVAVGSGVAPISSRTYLGDPGIPYKYQQLKGGAILSHAFTPQWSLRSAFRLALNKA